MADERDAALDGQILATYGHGIHTVAAQSIIDEFVGALIHASEYQPDYGSH
ncbi:hypothetical protein OSH11_11675 [Kaistia dalseonensis]|uniref:Uncharacterized protein n=1 Tax=Kaistia dalseonensis TaxID=410840 RepID=A0ABU0H6P1_9HYPH|nr:hypothetical protein [Kaistia dalseonensis]MCX5495369.1 hypothetical protein [Kaistia dalseonensis]MDQ0437956.1 hypothetical protein [Kaistia dalseonensis]